LNRKSIFVTYSLYLEDQQLAIKMHFSITMTLFSMHFLTIFYIRWNS